MTVVPGGTLAGTPTTYGIVTLVTAEVKVVSKVPLTPGPDTVTCTLSRPRLSVAVTLNAMVVSAGGVVPVTSTTGRVWSVRPPPVAV